uniref:Uncharacterized protein n=1 Tax=Timema douglasi TaxID=61478 RepID=A0A7R8VS38_TIMDO|nr:unnamed protein product [Timema douglasi]
MVTWTLDFFKKGYTRTLEIEDLYNPMKKDLSNVLGDRLERDKYFLKKRLLRLQCNTFSDPPPWNTPQILQFATPTPTPHSPLHPARIKILRANLYRRITFLGPICSNKGGSLLDGVFTDTSIHISGRTLSRNTGAERGGGAHAEFSARGLSFDPWSRHGT